MDTIWLEQSLSDVPKEDTWLSAPERKICDCFHIPKRRADWRLGRWTAKRAVAAYLRVPSHPGMLTRIEVRAASSGAPEAFLDGAPAEVSISITHRAGVAACAVGPSRMAIGCDLELIEPRTDAFVGDYFTAFEQHLVGNLPADDRHLSIALLWSAKESALKALKLGLRLDTRCVEVTLGENSHAAPNHFLQSSEDPASSDVAFHVGGWHPLAVAHPHGSCLRGWWLSTGEFVRTIVAVPSSSWPRILSAILR